MSKRLDEDIKLQIKGDLEAGATGQQIVDKYGVSIPTVHNIKKKYGLIKKKKTTTKKTTAKKKTAAKKATRDNTAPAPGPGPAPTPPGTNKQPSSFSILNVGDEYNSQVSELMQKMHSRKKTKMLDFAVKSPAEFDKTFVHMDGLPLQYALRTPGLARSSFAEIIGPEGIGKSTFVFWLMGQLMLQGSPALYLETEDKPMLSDRIRRCMHPDPTVADLLVGRLQMTQVFSIKHAITLVENWAEAQRDKLVQRSTGIMSSTPIVIAVDTWSKLMSPSEAVGRSVYDTAVAPKASQSSNEISEGGTNFEHSKLAHKWCRTLANFFEKYNVILLAVSHQNDYINMSAGPVGFSFGGEDTGKLYNKTTLGGKAFDQTASFQFIMNRIQKMKDSNRNPIGHLIRCRVEKNSYGPDNHMFEFVVDTTNHESQGYLQPALTFDHSTAKLFADRKLLNTRVDANRFTCPDLGVTNATAEDFCRALYGNPEILNNIRAQLGIYGYQHKESVSAQNDVGSSGNQHVGEAFSGIETGGTPGG